jgi:formimidoylglutamate deiminase
MYRAANTHDPETLFTVTRDCYREMLRAGITCVGEFHYLHHTPDGRPYADPNELSRQVIRAAEVVGIRLVLLEVYYARAGAGREPLPEQRRFCDGSVDAYLRRVDILRGEGVHIGVAPHSVRAVPREALRELAAYAGRHGLPMHAHVSEQPQENVECMAEHGCSPTALLAATGCLDAPGRLHGRTRDPPRGSGLHRARGPAGVRLPDDRGRPRRRHHPRDSSTCAAASASRSAATATRSST